MARIPPPVLSPDDAQRAENVIDDLPLPAPSRRALLQRVSTGAAAFGVLGLAACGSSGSGSGLARASRKHAPAPGRIQTLLNTAVTAEALAVTYLSGLLQNHLVPKEFVPVLKAANAAEYDHYKALSSLGAKPLTTKFWAPNSFFEKRHVFATIETAETLFVNAYLIAMTEFAKAGMAKQARYAGEILGTEAEHLALARFAQSKLPNDLGFMPYEVHDIGGIVTKLEGAGIGFGKKGSKPGRFYEFPGAPPASTVRHIDSEQVA